MKTTVVLFRVFVLGNLSAAGLCFSLRLFITLWFLQCIVAKVSAIHILYTNLILQFLTLFLPFPPSPCTFKLALYNQPDVVSFPLLRMAFSYLSWHFSFLPFCGCPLPSDAFLLALGTLVLFYSLNFLKDLFIY